MIIGRDAWIPYCLHRAFAESATNLLLIHQLRTKTKFYCERFSLFIIVNNPYNYNYQFKILSTFLV